MNKLIKGNIKLVGAGPGDPELITIKGIKAIQQATYILYDALIHKDLLEYNKRAIKMYVGKRAGLHSILQRDISLKMVTLASQGERVVRLKGGDVFVFGRANEELEMAQNAKIETEVIPGISSFSGIAARHKIPLTQRGIAESFWVTTGTTARGTSTQSAASHTAHALARATWLAVDCSVGAARSSSRRTVRTSAWPSPRWRLGCTRLSECTRPPSA
jgi:uroporphyrin-III C-methyltransferase